MQTHSAATQHLENFLAIFRDASVVWGLNGQDHFWITSGYNKYNKIPSEAAFRFRLLKEKK